MSTPPAPTPSHVSEHLANERTFLAWMRTSVAMVSLGFVLAKFSVWLRQFIATVSAAQHGVSPHLPRSGASLPAGLALMALGALTAVLALFRHRNIARAIDAGTYRPQGLLPALMAVAIAGVAVVVIIYLAVTNQQL